jgi:hypothetical protein
MTVVLFRAGDVLEGGADLTVLPCSAKGTVSRSARNRMEHYHLPQPTAMELGAIAVFPFPGPGSITKYVAWAASVLNDASSPETVSTIGLRLGAYANTRPEVCLIESPLLGTGAGHLDPIKAGLALRKGFKSACTVEATLIIYAYQTSIVTALRAAAASDDSTTTDVDNTQKDATMVTKAPRTFISYAWEGEAHRIWVRELATRLRRDGVDVRLDQWDTAPGAELTAYMESAIRDNDFVLMICTPTYKSKSDGRRGGVGYEGSVITGELFARGNHLGAAGLRSLKT